MMLHMESVRKCSCGAIKVSGLQALHICASVSLVEHFFPGKNWELSCSSRARKLERGRVVCAPRFSSGRQTVYWCIRTPSGVPIWGTGVGRSSG
jgi:hypothetical protein